MFRIVYWLGSVVTDWIVKAENVVEALKLFEEQKGDAERVISIAEV